VPRHRIAGMREEMESEDKVRSGVTRFTWDIALWRRGCVCISCLVLAPCGGKHARKSDPREVLGLESRVWGLGKVRPEAGFGFWVLGLGKMRPEGGLGCRV
jgi:hypothetical protein